MAVAIDYYELLGIPRGASDDQVKDGVKKAMREWRKRTEAADLSVRQEAELRVKNIAEANETLSNVQRRQQYDAKLEREGVAKKSADTGGGAGTDWLEKAKSYLAVNDYHSAAYAAREATQSSGNSPECWWIRSRANLGLNKLDDAYYEAQQAVELETTNPEYRFHLGSVAEGLERWDKAVSEYQEAARLDPTETMYPLAVGGVYLQNGQPEKALPIVEPIYRAHPDDEMAGFYYAGALVDSAERVPAHRDGTSYIVTTGEELTRMQGLLRQASAIRKLPPDMRDSIRHVQSYLDRMAKQRFHVPFGQAKFSGPTRSAIGACIGLFILGVFALSGILSVFSGSVGGFFFGLVLAGADYLWFRTVWVPQWKVNARMQQLSGRY